MKTGTGSELTGAAVTTNGRREAPVPFWVWRRRVAAVVLCGATATVLWASHAAILRGMACWLDVGRQPHRADYVMVLSGGEETRPFAGAALLRAGFADRALVARVAAAAGRLAKVAAESSEINRRVLVARGVEPSRVTVLPGAAKTTYDEATALSSLSRSPSLRQRTGRYRRISHPAEPVGVSARSGRAGKPGRAGFRPDRRVRHRLLVARPVGAGGRRRRVPEICGLLVYYGHVLPWLAACLVLAAVARCANRM